MISDLEIIEEKCNCTSDEKLKFCGYGEWIEEADVIHFEYLGYKACIRRVFEREPLAKEEFYFGGHLCGYVKIPEDHPFFGQEDIDLECHGGLTFNECPGEHWIGFDCGHFMDFIPTVEQFRSKMPGLMEIRKHFGMPKILGCNPLFKPVYRNMNYCIEECKTIINQLIEAKK